jgi:hypothetical protein
MGTSDGAVVRGPSGCVALCEHGRSRYGRAVSRARVSLWPPSRTAQRVTRRPRLCAWLCALCFAIQARNATAEDVAPAPKRIVFFTPAQLEPNARSALEDALSTQLSLLSVQVSFQLNSEAQLTLEQRIEQSRAANAEHAAIGTFWLEIRPNSAWYVYAMDSQDPNDQRLVIRRLEELPKSTEAAAESVALIVRATTDALLHGEPLEHTPPPPAAPKTSPPPAAEPLRHPPPTEVVIAPAARSALRIAAGYVGTTFAREVPWQNGLVVRAMWIWPAGPYLGLGYSFLPLVRRLTEDVDFRVARRPIALLAGLRFPTGNFTFSAELGAELELRERETTYIAGAGPTPPTSTRSRWLPNVCPKLESEYLVTSWLGVFANLGADFVLGSFPYTYGSLDGPKLLYPHAVRLTVQVGIGIIR